jgi:hypothetical protein
MHGRGESAQLANRLQGAGIAGTAGVQHDFTAQLLPSNSSKFGGNFGDRVVGDAQQNSSGGQSMMTYAREGAAGADKFRGFAGGGVGARGDNQDTPPAFVQQPPKRSSHAPGSENGQGLRHPC